AWEAEPTRRLYRLKRRPETMPSALLCAHVDALLECLPELSDGAEAVARALLPGPYTLVFANPGRRFPWLTGARPDTIGVRVPALAEPVRTIVARAGA